MAFSKKEEIKAGSIAKTLSHPARVAIIKSLSPQKTFICNDLAEHLPLSQSTVSQYLKKLKNAGLTSGEIDGYAITSAKKIEKKQKKFSGNYLI